MLFLYNTLKSSLGLFHSPSLHKAFCFCLSLLVFVFQVRNVQKSSLTDCPGQMWGPEARVRAAVCLRVSCLQLGFNATFLYWGKSYRVSMHTSLSWGGFPRSFQCGCQHNGKRAKAGGLQSGKQRIGWRDPIIQHSPIALSRPQLLTPVFICTHLRK